MLLRTVRSTIEKYGMLAGGDRVVIALSGGPDSMALVHVLNSLKGVYRIDLHAAHLEHGIRGDESLEDMKFVQDVCKDLSIPLTTKREEVPEIARERKLSLEATARKLRYAFLDEVAGDKGAAKIATGHNANDQAETLLMNLLRGSGMAGLTGIRPAIEDRIIRPLIEATRKEIEAYIEEKQIDFRSDSSNLDTRFDRNKVRQLLIPLIEKEFNPRIVDSLARTASVFSSIDGYLKDRMKDVIEACCRVEDGRATIDLEVFRGTPQALQLFALYSILRSLEADQQVVSFDILNAILNLATRSKSGSRVDIGSGLAAMREFDQLVIGRDLALMDRYEARINIPGSTQLEAADYSFEAEVLNERPGSGEVYRSGETAYFDFSKLELPLLARSWREGDRLVPFGLSGSKKVHDIFIDEKVPISQRSRIPIITDGEGIIWIAGIRRGERARVTDDTRTILKITYRKGG